MSYNFPRILKVKVIKDLPKRKIMEAINEATVVVLYIF